MEDPLPGENQYDRLSIHEKPMLYGIPKKGTFLNAIAVLSSSRNVECMNLLLKREEKRYTEIDSIQYIPKTQNSDQIQRLLHDRSISKATQRMVQ